MSLETVITTVGLSSLISLNVLGFGSDVPKKEVLSSHEISLEKRYNNVFVNEVFSDNILLNLAYLNERVDRGDRKDWGKVRKPQAFSFTLSPGETFAFHEDVSAQYEGKVVKTTNAHFNYADGFRNSGYLFGDGVCHLASLMFWVAKDAGLEAFAPTNHDFRDIPQIPREFGASIYYMPGSKAANALQNLYITNKKNKAVSFAFVHTGETLSVSVSE